MNMAWKGKYDYAKYQEQGGFVLPVLCVWRCDFDWVMIREVPANF